MTAAALIEHLRRRGVVLTAEGDRLRYRAPQGILRPEDLGRLRQAKPTILAALRAGRAPKVPSPAPESLSAPREARRPTWADLSRGERAVIAKAREAYPDDFDRMLIARFARGETSASAEIAVVLDLLDRELGLDRKGPIGRARGRRP